ncbi:MAG: ferrous iron transporter B, partial [Clostridia bacterium]|nr:ferrous iron transporter B [Clostridia bacterium]
IPVVVALNKADVNKKKHTTINVNLLASQLNCPVVETVSLSGNGLKKVVETAVAVVGRGQAAPYNQGDVDLSDKHAVEEADRKRFDFVNSVVSQVETRKEHTNQRNKQDKLDEILTNKWLGIPIFAVVMFLVFGISQAWLGPWLADLFVGVLEMGQEAVANALNSDSIWASILVDGVIGGVIAVVGFLPLVMVMYFLIALLEDCGYMARATVVLDPIFKKVGLSGKSVIPFVIGTGCAIPGVMACRTIRNERERRATAMLAPFMPCGAKLPVIALFAGVFFADSPWVGVTMYFVGIAIILLCALLINKLTGHKNRKSYFIIELPEYKWPSLWGACKSMLSRGWSYIVKAGTIILVCNFVVHVMQNFNWSFEVVEAGQSILHDIATPFAYAIAPVIGICAWQLAAAAVTGFIAKENVVGTIAVCYSITNFINVEDLVLEGGANEVAQIMGIVKVAALAYLMFNLFTPPCFAAIGAMNAEIKSKKWLFAGIGLQLAVGYTVGFLVMFFGTLFTQGFDGLVSANGFASAWMPIVGWAVVLAIAGLLTALVIKKEKQLKKEYALKA